MSETKQRRVVTTEELMALVASGKRVTFRQVTKPDADVLRHFPSDDVDRLYVPAQDNPVIGVEYVRDEPVQCISVDHPDHLYITDTFIPTHNTSNIVFLKSTDDSMLDTLSKISGTRHVSYIDSKTVTRDQERIIKGMNVEGKVSYTMSTKEEPVISYNDMAFISERNSIVFRAGDAPVWNRNETILPMSWRLFRDTIIDPGHDYSLQTIPTLSTALDFDVRQNQPDFYKMLAKRMEQAVLSTSCREKYRKAFGYSEIDITRLDPDVYSDEVMELIDAQMREEFVSSTGADPDEIDPDDLEDVLALIGDPLEDAEMRQELAARSAKADDLARKRYAGERISRDMFVNPDGTPKRNVLDAEIVAVYKVARQDLAADRLNFSVDGNGWLRSADGRQVYVSVSEDAQDLDRLEQAAEQDGERVFAEDSESVKGIGNYRVHPEFYAFLARLESWHDLARGEFERGMARIMREQD